MAGVLQLNRWTCVHGYGSSGGHSGQSVHHFDYLPVRMLRVSSVKHCIVLLSTLISMTVFLYLQIKISQDMSSMFRVMFIEKVLDCIFSNLSLCKRTERSLQSFPSLHITVVWSHETLCRQKHSVPSSLPVASSHYLPSACLSVGV